MIRKLMILAATGVCAAAMASGVWADDIVVNTSVGSGEVVFTQTDETAEITEEELTELVKEAARQAGDLTMIDAFLDAEADVSIKLGAENEMAIKASAIGMADRYEDKGYGSFYYSLEGLGTPQSAQFEAYHWVDGDTHYTSVSDGSAWKTTAEDAVQETLLRLWQLRDRMKDYQRPEALATIIAKNVCINFLKRGGTQHDVLDERLCIEASSKTDQTVIVQDAERRIGQALARLPKTQRRLLKMRSDGMSIFEIATACNLTPASTKTMICAARRTMMELLKTGRKKK